MSADEDCDAVNNSSNPHGNESSLVACSNPVVFQCSHCECIVGDSTSWVTSNKVMRTITLGGVTSKVGIRSDVELANGGIDKGSTFHQLYCSSCEQNLGRQYLASPPSLDNVRGLFTFSVEALNSYEVGSASSKMPDVADLLDIPTSEYMLQKISKLQFVLVSMNERIQNLEAYLGCQVPAQQHFKGTSCDGLVTNDDVQSVSSSENFSTNARSFSRISPAVDELPMDVNSDKRYATGSSQDLYLAQPLNESNVPENVDLMMKRDNQRPQRNYPLRKRHVNHNTNS